MHRSRDAQHCAQPRVFRIGLKQKVRPENSECPLFRLPTRFSFKFPQYTSPNKPSSVKTGLCVVIDHFLNLFDGNV